MKAVYLTGHGGNEVVAIGERPLPVRQPGEVLVRLHAATLNRVDLYMRDSGAGITHALPQVMGIDGAGVVVECDEESSGVTVEGNVSTTADGPESFVTPVTARSEATRQSVDRHAALAMTGGATAMTGGAAAMIGGAAAMAGGAAVMTASRTGMTGMGAAIRGGLQPGDRVLLYPGITCGHCEFCVRGDEVLCTTMQLLGEHRDGTLAEYIRVPARNAVPMPEGWSFEEAAALGVNHLTAWRMLMTQARLKPRETVLIFGIGGGVSLAGLQLAKAIGAHAIVTSREPDKCEGALALGADAAICSRTHDVVQEVMRLTGKRGVDVVFENVGAAVWDSALRSAVRGGRIVTCGATTGDQPGADLRRVFIRQLQIHGSTLGNLSELRELVRFCAQHNLRPVMDRVYALDEAHAALDRLASGEQFGKVAVRIA